MNNLAILTLIAFVGLLSGSQRVAQAGPLHHSGTVTTMRQSFTGAISSAFNLRKKREIYPEIMDDQPEPDSASMEKVGEDQSQQVCVVGDLVYEAEEPVPAEQPCLKCKCQPPGVHCETTRCEKKPGCRAIHKPNTCCPEYQCECEYEGRSYANGERLEQKPGTECKVCYCRGGEVQCAEVSCYIRNDCEGRHVPGKCCPKYDHCPPKEPSNIFFANEINDTKQTIKIQAQIELESNIPEHEIEEEEHQEITIHEIIPEIKEIPITNSPKREINTVNNVNHKQLIVEEKTTHNEHEKQQQNQHEEEINQEDEDQKHNDLPTGDSDSDGSEVAEIYQHPPSVLRIGDKLLFLKKDGEVINEKGEGGVGVSTPATVITIIGAEGLQRGGVDIEETPEVRQEDLKNKTSLDDLPDDPEDDDIQTVAESTYILSLVRRPGTVPVASTTESSTTDQENATDTSGNSTEFAEFTDEAIFGNFTEDPLLDFDDFNSSTTNLELSSTSVPLTSDATPNSVSSSTTITQEKEKEKEEVQESNPEYPPIPDVMTQQVEESEPQPADANLNPAATAAQGKILPEVFELQAQNSNSTLRNASTGANDGVSGTNAPNVSWLKKTLLNPAAALPDSILSSVAESDSNLTTTSTSSTNPQESETTTTTSSASTNLEAEEVSMTIETSTSTSITAETTLGTTQRSKETIETMESLEESKETVTHDHASILNDESNASIEEEEDATTSSTSNSSGSEQTSTAELVEMLPGFELADASTPTPELNTNKTKPIDVEMIDVDLLRGHNSDEVAKNSTHEGAQTKTKIGKRESNEDESIFEELSREIALDSGTLVEEELPKEQSDDEAKQIFKELVDEATSNTTPKPVNLQGTAAPQTREQQQQAMALARIGDALAKLQLRDSKKGGGGVDTNVLGILRDFFTAQYRAYN